MTSSTCSGGRTIHSARHLRWCGCSDVPKRAPSPQTRAMKTSGEAAALLYVSR